jgi:hypothetical protein
MCSNCTSKEKEKYSLCCLFKKKLWVRPKDKVTMFTDTIIIEWNWKKPPKLNYDSRVATSNLLVLSLNSCVCWGGDEERGEKCTTMTNE